MKNLLAIMLAGVVLVACSENSSTSSSPEASAVTVTPALMVTSAPVASQPMASNQATSVSK